MVNQATINLSRNEKIKIAIIFAVLITITAIGFSAAFVIGKIAVVLGGLGIVAYVFGLRHGVDADHIAAIDNTTRKLMQEGKRPYHGWHVVLFGSFNSSCGPDNRVDIGNKSRRNQHTCPSKHWRHLRHAGFRKFPLDYRLHKRRHRDRYLQDFPNPKTRQTQPGRTRQPA